MHRYQQYLPDDVDLGGEIFVAMAETDEELVEKQRQEELAFYFIDKPLIILLLILGVVVNLFYIFSGEFDFSTIPISIIAITIIYIPVKIMELIEIKYFPGGINKKYDQMLDEEEEIVGVFENGIVLGPFISGEDHIFIQNSEIGSIELDLYRPVKYNNKDYYAIRITLEDGSTYRVNWEEFIYVTYPSEEVPSKAILEDFSRFYDALEQKKIHYNL